ncbi:MAG: hypothetical protein JWN48_4853 [Myxococcaceae bacterium]|nr:hypothetical protein [Myxococcaceae bacterium]
MALSDRERTRYARQLLLSQLGEAGQERLLRAAACAPAQADGGALEVARIYLERAGVRVVVHESLPEHGTHAQELALPSSAELTRIAGAPELEPAARALMGALAAVRALQDAAALPSSPLPSQSFAISSEEA